MQSGTQACLGGGAASFMQAFFFGAPSNAVHAKEVPPERRVHSSQSSYIDDSDDYLSPSEEEALSNSLVCKVLCNSNKKPQQSEINHARQLTGPKVTQPAPAFKKDSITEHEDVSDEVVEDDAEDGAK